MYKRLISIFLALCLSFSCFCVPASAVPVSTEIDMVNDFSRFISDLSDDYRSYKNGDISLDDFFNSTMTHATTELAPNICADITSIKDILRVMEFCGIDVSDAWEQFYYNQQMGGDGSGGNRDDSILNGCSCAAFQYRSDGTLLQAIYGSNGSLEEYQTGKYSASMLFDVSYVYKSDGTTVSNTYYDGSKTFTYELGSSWVLYGDWAITTLNDEPVPDGVITELPEKEVPAYDDDSLTDDDLIDFFEDLLNELLMQFPDLSTIEGLLRAILAKCESIDSKINETGSGMNPAELQVMLDKAILSLTLQNKVNNDALFNELVNIRKILQGYADDEEIPPDEANSILDGLISGITSGLISLIGLGLGDTEVTELIEVFSEAGTVGTKLLSGIVDIICFLGALVPFSIVKSCMESVFAVIFNNNTPVDLTFTLDGQQYTFLSASFLDIPIVSGSLSIIKGLLTIIILFGWLKWARKFYIDLM